MNQYETPKSNLVIEKARTKEKFDGFCTFSLVSSIVAFVILILCSEISESKFELYIILSIGAALLFLASIAFGVIGVIKKCRYGSYIVLMQSVIGISFSGYILISGIYSSYKLMKEFAG